MGLEEKTRRAKLVTRLHRLLDEYADEYEIEDVPGRLTISYATPETAEPSEVPTFPDDDRTLADLRAQAGDLAIAGRSKMTRDELIIAIADATTEAALEGESADEGDDAAEDTGDDAGAAEGDDDDA
jgi:hypothetical protein